MPDPFGFEIQFGQLENHLWGEAFGDEFYDPVAQYLYHEAYFNSDNWGSGALTRLRDDLRSYLMSEYGMSFDAVFDWEVWREAYDNAA